jgi:hypothetical protein
MRLKDKKKMHCTEYQAWRLKFRRNKRYSATKPKRKTKDIMIRRQHQPKK